MDILLPYVDMDDPEWLQVFMEAKGMHPRNERAYRAFLAPFKRRFSSHGLFKYWWRALEANYRSLGKVHLLLMQESQYPSFLRKDDPRIVVHYHDEFIPKEYLPCFNSSTIELCAIRNLELSDNFILANDDMYTNSPVDDTCFEQDGKPLAFKVSGNSYGMANTFRHTLTNGHSLVWRHYNVPVPFYEWHHLFQVYNATFCKQFLDSEWDAVVQGLSPWRKDSNYNHMMLMMAQNISGFSIHSPEFPHEGYFEMPDFTEAHYASADKCKVVCLNDTDGKNIASAYNYLQNRYADKCSFETIESA